MAATAVLATRSGEWVEDPGFGIYVHVPFCRHRCHYCDFNTYEGLDDLFEPYVDALVMDIRRWTGGEGAADSIFFGGGTPTLLPPAQLVRVLDALRGRFGVAPGAEITVEANPETVDERYLSVLREGGFNRLSIGVQSLSPDVLAALGRTHSVEAAPAAVAAGRAAGFEDINVDLIYGSPWETDEQWRTSLEGAIAAEPAHVSAYALTVEEGTPLDTLVRSGRVPDVDPDVQAARHGVAEELLGTVGLDRYEISNWSRPGHASRHNVLYWCAGDYLGFGAGAHGHVAGRRWWSVRLPRDYIAAVGAGSSVEAGSETLSSGERAGEALTLGLRLASGVKLDGFARRFGPEPLAGRGVTIASLLDAGLIERADGWLRLTPPTTMIANEVLCRLL